MAWEGFFEYAGTEIINVSRVEAYARHLGWFKPTFSNDVLMPMLGDRVYRSPLQDDPPWADPDDQASYDFLGVYPLSVDGFDSSSRTSTVTESTTDGGTAGRLRFGTKAFVFNTLLVATSEAGAEYGKRWLERALMGGGPCGPDATEQCFGAPLCYLSSEPEADLAEIPWGSTAAVAAGGTAGLSGPTTATGGSAGSDAEFDPDHLGDTLMSGGDAGTTSGLLSVTKSMFTVTTLQGNDPVECLIPYLRSRRQVVFNNGPTVTAKHKLTGGEVWMATFTGVAEIPAEFGPETEVVRGFLDPDVDVPWAGGVTPQGGAIDLDGYMMADESPCNQATPTPIFDPQHPAVLLPPGAPSVPLGYFTPPVNWRRRQFTIPKQYVPLWGEMVPKLSVHARDDDVRNLRLRFYADPYEVGDVSDDPCAFCGDVILSYIPAGTTMILDGTDETVWVREAGGIERRADSLVFSSDGTPFSWPRLSCGFGYVVTVDTAEQDPVPSLDLSLFERIL